MSNLSDAIRFSSVFLSFFLHLNSVQELKFKFCQIKLLGRITDKLAVNRKNFAKFNFSSSLLFTVVR